MTSHRENEQENRKKILLWSVGATTFLISEYFGMSMKYVGYDSRYLVELQHWYVVFLPIVI